MVMEEAAYFHEDHYNQIEILPAENLFEASREIEMLGGESIHTLTEDGFEHIYNRKDASLPLHHLNIGVEEIRLLLEELSFKYYDKVETGYSSTRIPKENCFAYGYENYIIFVAHNNQIVHNIWITFSLSVIKEEVFPTNLILTLLKIKDRWNVILIDWNEEVIVFLYRKEQIEEYFNLITGYKFIS
jgi:hypothetical protein